MLKQVVVAVLAGGDSARMGVDKATVELDGHTMLEKVASAAMEAGLPVWVIGRNSDDPVMNGIDGAVAIPDDVPGLGPLGGLATALRKTPENVEVLLAACDLPLVTAKDFSWLASIANADKTGAADGIVPAWRGIPEPTFAVYRRTALPMVERHIAMKRLSLHDLIRTGAFVQVPLPAEHASAVKDADTPDQLRDLMRGF